MMTRRTFASALAAGATVMLMPCLVSAENGPAARNIVLVHGLFADGSCWSEVIARLQAAGLNVTSVQNPLTTLDDAVAATQRVLARQDGPTVLVGHSFAGMIVTEAGVDPRSSPRHPRQQASCSTTMKADSPRQRSCAILPATSLRPARGCSMRLNSRFTRRS